MNKAIIGIVAVIMWTAIAGLWAQEQPQKSSGSHLGTWRLASKKYGADQEFSEFPPEQRRIKLITETHFTWVQFDTATKKSQGMAGGAYSLSGNTYTESVDWADSGTDSYLGKKHVFIIRVEGDKMFLSGSLPDGLKLEEIWERVK